MQAWPLNGYNSALKYCHCVRQTVELPKFKVGLHRDIRHRQNLLQLGIVYGIRLVWYRYSRYVLTPGVRVLGTVRTYVQYRSEGSSGTPQATPRHRSLGGGTGTPVRTYVCYRCVRYVLLAKRAHPRQPALGVASVPVSARLRKTQTNWSLRFIRRRNEISSRVQFWISQKAKVSLNWVEGEAVSI